MRILRNFYTWTKFSPSACASRGSHRGAGANWRWRHLWAREWLRGWNGGSRRLRLLHPGAKKQQRRGNSRLDGCLRLQKQCNPWFCVEIGLLWLQVRISHLSFISTSLQEFTYSIVRNNSEWARSMFPLWAHVSIIHMDWAPWMPASSLQSIANLVCVVLINDFFWNENLVVNFLSSIPTLHSQCPYFVQRSCL